MSLERLFESAVAALRTRGIPFAVAGGLAANLYRNEPRLTMDVDLAVFAKGDVLQVAVALLAELGLETGIAREADLAGGPLFAIRNHSTPPCVVVGRLAGISGSPGVDILLPTLPWTEDAVRRGQENKVDFGFGPVPTLTFEDVIIAKLFALRSVPLRAKDLDDLQAILGDGSSVDLAYLAGQTRRFSLAIPAGARQFLPDWIRKMIRGNLRADRRQ